MNLNIQNPATAYSADRRTRRQTDKMSDSAGAHTALEHLAGMFQRGEIDACISAAGRFTKTWPMVAVGWQILAACCQAKGDFKNAETAGRQALRVDDNCPDAHNIHGNTLKVLGDVQGAGFHFGRAIELKPHHAEAHSNLGAVLIDLARLDEAETVLRRAIALQPGLALAHYHLGSVLRDTDRLEEAQGRFETALQLQPSMTDAQIGLGHLMTHRGDFATAESYYRTAIALEPSNGAYHYHLSFVKKFCADDPDLAAITEALQTDLLSVSDRVHLHYAAGKAHDDAGNAFDVAFDHFDQAAQLRRSQLKFNMDHVETDFQRVERFFTASTLRDHAGAGDSSAQPVFIVGMPRSGTTLVEQILASHRDVHATGERDDLARVAKSVDATMKGTFPDWISDLDPHGLAQMGRKYIEKISAGAPNRARITDKMLTNFKLLGLIALILPNAKVVHVRRHPLDSCLSCYCQPFTSGSKFSYDLGELGRYYHAYHRLMMHWQQALPAGLLMTIDYEDLVEAPENSARALIIHCGLDWDENCLNFQNAERPVKTASASQVRQKLYTSSIGRWKNYKQHLAPLVEALGELSHGHARSAPVSK